MNASDLLNAWNTTLSTNDENALGQYLSESFTFTMLGQNTMTQNAHEHLSWCVTDDSPQISDFHILYDDGEVCSGTHAAKMANGQMFDVMFFGEYGEKLDRWHVLLAPQG